MTGSNLQTIIDLIEQPTLNNAQLCQLLSFMVQQPVQGTDVHLEFQADDGALQYRVHLEDTFLTVHLKSIHEPAQSQHLEYKNSNFYLNGTHCDALGADKTTALLYLLVPGDLSTIVLDTQSNSTSTKRLAP